MNISHHFLIHSLELLYYMTLFGEMAASRQFTFNMNIGMNRVTEGRQDHENLSRSMKPTCAIGSKLP